MKKSLTLISLIAALAAGSAGAAGTTAGTTIQNTATATFTDPDGNPLKDGNNNPYGTTANPLSSNTVSTTVKAVPVFSITPNDAGAAGVPDQDSPGQSKTGVLPGSVQQFGYTISNAGNTPVVAQLDPRLATANVDRSDTDVDNLKYFVWNDSNSDGVLDAGEVGAELSLVNGVYQTPTISADGTYKVVQQYKVPDTATPGQFYGANPVGTALYDSTPDATTPGNNTYAETVPNPTTGTGTLTDNDNFNRVQVYSPGVNSGPNDGDNSSTGGNTNGYTPVTTTVTVPGTTTPGAGYTDPGSTIISVVGNDQIAYPKADNDLAANTVTFTNSITNNGTLSDTFELIAPGGLPSGTTVTFRDASGNALPDADSDGKPELAVGAGQTVNFRVIVAYPDTESATPPAASFDISVGADSGNDSDSAADTTVKDTVKTPGLQFGDATVGIGANASDNPQASVVPGTSNNKAYFPMDVYNAGGYADTFTLAGSVVIPTTTSATPAPTALTYYTYTDSNNDGTFTAGTDTLGTPLASGVTPSLAPGAEYKVVGIVTVPNDALSTLTSSPLTVTQSATGAYSTIKREDLNDTIRVGGTGLLDLRKFVDNCGKTNTACPTARVFTDTPANNSAAPQEVLRYTIIAKNNTNNVVKGLTIKDTVPANTSFVSVAGSAVTSTGTALSGTIYYRFNGGSWSTSDTGSLTSGQSIEVAIDTNNSGGIDAGDSLPVGAELHLDFRTKIN